jgi:hypothetical protein
MEFPYLPNENSPSPYLSPLKDCVMIEGTKEPEILIRQRPRCPGDGQAAEGALDLPARSRFGEGRAEPLSV